jgi:hypothetical protein
VRSIVRPKLGENIRNVALNGRFPNRELISDQFVGIPGRNQPQYVHFAWTQVVIRRMFRQFGGDLGRNLFLSSVDGTDGTQEFPMHFAL